MVLLLFLATATLLARYRVTAIPLQRQVFFAVQLDYCTTKRHLPYTYAI